MFAIIELGTKQYLIKEGDLLEAQGIKTSQKEVKLDRVLLVAKQNDYKIGSPYVEKAFVRAEIFKELKGPKIVSYKYRRRKSSHWKKGHRQRLVVLKINEIVCN